MQQNITLQLNLMEIYRVLKLKSSWNFFNKNDGFFVICQPLHVIFIHYKSRISATIRGL